jgi:NADH:ubiquinone oxidoreductase subunit B-like Fe-S oxidoreductase
MLCSLSFVRLLLIYKHAKKLQDLIVIDQAVFHKFPQKAQDVVENTLMQPQYLVAYGSA